MNPGIAPKTPPIDPAGFRSVWEDAKPPKRVLLAVSGGSDSMALMHLATPIRKLGAEISVATVDHGLRSASRAEAERVAHEADELGLGHETLVWGGEKPKAGVQAAARTARYYLLAENAARNGCGAVVTAHTADDQAETVAMRMRRSASPHSLAGMAADSLIAAGPMTPVRLIRPLLGVRRTALRDFLRTKGALWIEDPSNDDPAFERVRVRRDLAMRGDAAIEALLETAADARAEVRRLGAHEQARLVELGAEFEPSGGVALRYRDLLEADARLIAGLIWAVSGAEHVPSVAAARRALERMRRERSRTTLSGALLVVDGRRLRIVREPAALLGRADTAACPPTPIPPGERRLWDNRFIIVNAMEGDAEIAPVGSQAPARMYAAAPALWRNGALIASAFDGGGDFQPLAEERFYRRVVRFH